MFSSFWLAVQVLAIVNIGILNFPLGSPRIRIRQLSATPRQHPLLVDLKMSLFATFFYEKKVGKKCHYQINKPLELRSPPLPFISCYLDLTRLSLRLSHWQLQKVNDQRWDSATPHACKQRSPAPAVEETEMFDQGVLMHRENDMRSEISELKMRRD